MVYKAIDFVNTTCKQKAKYLVAYPNTQLYDVAV